jgi:hypothetical protein
MRLLKQYPLLRLVNSYVVDSPQPANLSYMWNFGSLLATCLGLQIVTGVILAMHYTPNIDLAFISVEHIMRDVNYGWLLRYLHANGASFFFILVYAHIGRGLYYGSFKEPRVMPWSVGVIILVLMMAIAFLGYVLPYGQMSLWGATVITNMLSAIPWIGQDFVQFVFLSTPVDYEVFMIQGPLALAAEKGRRGCRPLQIADYNIPVSVLALFIGLVDGDGTITIGQRKDGNMIIYLCISLQLADAFMLYELQKLMLGLGNINEYPNIGCVKYTFGVSDLLYIILPLMELHNLSFLTDTRRKQFDLVCYIIIHGLTKWNTLPVVVPSFSLPLPSTPQGYLDLPWFSNWLVGFVIAEGSFHVKSNGDICFSITQRPHLILFEAFKLLFDTTVKIFLHKGSIKFVVTSVKNLTSVVRFFSHSGHMPLMGLKLISYQRWLGILAKTPRTAHLVRSSTDSSG